MCLRSKPVDDEKSVFSTTVRKCAVLAATKPYLGCESRDNPRVKKIVILISGAGSNMAAIVQTAQQQSWRERLGVVVSAVISNKPQASGLAWVRSDSAHSGIQTDVLDHTKFESREDFDQALMQRIDLHAPDLVVLAGFMRILTPGFVAHYAGRLINIHPSLLPAFTGLNTHQRAIDAGCKFAGATVHQVTAELDHGQILAQAVVPVLSGDTSEALAARVLTQEHLIYPAAVAAFFKR
ncbi:MAG: Phosphoribosylglycinamide formyltransferase [Pseudomonadota bacterium]